jgi:hypothetical protein
MILSLPVMKIINSSYTENKLPPIWKKANIIPVPKVTPAHDRAFFKDFPVGGHFLKRDLSVR